MRKLASIVLGKSVYKATRFLNKGGGSAAPGLYALKLNPNLVEDLSSRIPTNIVITGTNGKTTTSKMLSHFANAQGLKVIRNHTGSNLERGIASALVSNYGKSFNLGVWETDEAAFNTIASKVNPKIIVFLNVFRDQLDRYGEIDSLVKKWGETLQKLSKNTIVLINGDDVNTNKLRGYFKGKIYTFGLESNKIKGDGALKREKVKLDFAAKNIKLDGLTGSRFELKIESGPPKGRLKIHLSLPGAYHIYDFLASFTAGHILGFDVKKMIPSLKTFSPAFGRVEKLDFGYIFLIKNPAGATQVFQTLAPQFKKHDRLLLALNDNLADGTDVSWIWDANFEVLQNSSRAKSRNLSVYVSGTKAYDLANRLKYAGFDTKQMIIEPDIEKAFKEAKKGLKSLPAGRQGRLFILPTYTAMLEIQNILARSGIKKKYWKEEEN